MMLEHRLLKEAFMLLTGLVPVSTPRFHRLDCNVVIVVNGYTGHGLARTPHDEQGREIVNGASYKDNVSSFHFKNPNMSRPQ